MSDTMKKTYQNDVNTFYKAFTGKSSVPPSIKKFSDIQLRDFAGSDGCKKDNLYTKEYEGSANQSLFKKYANHIQNMIKTAQQNQNALLNILDQIFVWNLDPAEQTKQILINPSLNEKKLDELIASSRQLIIKCYITCENDFIKGLEIFEAIVEKQIMSVTKSQIDNLEKTIQSTLVNSPTNEKSTSKTETENSESLLKKTTDSDGFKLAETADLISDVLT